MRPNAPGAFLSMQMNANSGLKPHALSPAMWFWKESPQITDGLGQSASRSRSQQWLGACGRLAARTSPLMVLGRNTVHPFRP